MAALVDVNNKITIEKIIASKQVASEGKTVPHEQAMATINAHIQSLYSK